MARFRDKTNRPGPATWELSRFPEGEGDLPVGGVSWYEAMAYAAFAGKALPSAFEWTQAAGLSGYSSNFSDILLASNFNGKGPSPRGQFHGMSVFGAYDMAGNVKEWCWNETEIGRMILGGGWNEQSYMFSDRDARAPLDRRPDNGFRLVKRLDTPSLAAMERLERRTRDYTKEKPISDEAFAVARGLYNYDPVPLDARIDNVEETADWRKETVSIAAAYSGERLPAYLYLPKNARPPFQVVVYFPGGDATMMRSSRELRLRQMDFLIRSGRAVLYPVYKGTYERVSPNTGTNALRDLTIARIKDVRRSMDYLATRQDIDIDRVGYYGISLGAFLGIFSTALEPRFKATVFVGSGLTSIRYPAEMDPLNFLPRIKTPTLLVNGKDDFAFPLEASQRPLVQLLGAREKQLVSFDGGHILVRVNEVVRVILDWFDKHLGPVALSLG